MHAILLQAKGARWVIVGLAGVDGLASGLLAKLIPYSHYRSLHPRAVKTSCSSQPLAAAADEYDRFMPEIGAIGTTGATT